MRSPRLFLLAAVAVAALNGCTRDTATVLPAASTTPPGVPTVVALKAVQPRPWSASPTSWNVDLSWSTTALSTDPLAEIDHYQLARDGRTIDRHIEGTAFRDKDVRPSATYRYRVVAVDTDGRPGRAAGLVVKTGEPPLADARLEGSYLIRLSVVSSNLSPNAMSTIVRFKPTCKTGTCPVTYQRPGRGAATGTISQDGTHLHGTISAPFQIRSCSGATIDETLAFDLHIVRARVAGTRWQADKLEGTLDESAPSSGCVTGYIHWSLLGKAS